MSPVHLVEQRHWVRAEELHPCRAPVAMGGLRVGGGGEPCAEVGSNCQAAGMSLAAGAWGITGGPDLGRGAQYCRVRAKVDWWTGVGLGLGLGRSTSAIGWDPITAATRRKYCGSKYQRIREENKRVWQRNWRLAFTNDLFVQDVTSLLLGPSNQQGNWISDEFCPLLRSMASIAHLMGSWANYNVKSCLFKWIMREVRSVLWSRLHDAVAWGLAGWLV